MTRWAVAFAALSALTAAVLAAGCAAQVPARGTEPEPDVATGTRAPALSAPAVTCGTEAEQLLNPVRVLTAPAESAAELASLRAGRMIYRCNRWKDWIAISYPAEGEPVDCASRKEQRRCAVGWIKGGLQTSTFG